MDILLVADRLTIRSQTHARQFGWEAEAHINNEGEKKYRGNSQKCLADALQSLDAELRSWRHLALIQQAVNTLNKEDKA